MWIVFVNFMGQSESFVISNNVVALLALGMRSSKFLRYEKINLINLVI